MSWFKGLFDPPHPVHPSRWIVLDVETSGLDPRADRLLAIAALAVIIDFRGKKMMIDVSDSFEAVLRQDEVSDKSNILLHGIGANAQRTGSDPRFVLHSFKEWVADAPLFAFHAPFDEAMIQRAYQDHLGKKIKNIWIDIEPLASIAYRKIKARSLDQWMAEFGIECAVRHQAAADTFATAELFMKIWPSLTKLTRNIYEIERLAEQSRWVPRG